MAAPTTIRGLTVEPLDIPLREPFSIAGVVQHSARNLLVTVELADGTRGYGEAAPLPEFNGETREQAAAALADARSLVEGADVREWRRIAASIRDAIGRVGSARCAIETAIFDALTRRARLPLWAFFGGVSTRLETDMTLPLGTVEQAASAAREFVARGVRAIKVKVGGRDLSLDVERITAIHAGAPELALHLDGNGGYSGDRALQLLARLHLAGITPALFEQPVPSDDWPGLRQVAQWGGVPVAADESVCDAGDALRVAQERAAQVVNVKLMKAGVVEALDIAALCRATFLRLMIGGLIESMLGVTMSACFAAGLGGFHYVDLDAPRFLAANPFEGGCALSDGQIDLSPIAAGHGVSPRAR